MAEADELGEAQFIAELARRSGCGLLLDVNNVYVSASNMGYSADDYIDRFPGEAVLEIHLAGHTPDPTLHLSAPAPERRNQPTIAKTCPTLDDAGQRNAERQNLRRDG